MASFIDKKLECVLIADGITKNSCKLMARDFIHCDGLEDVLVSFVTAVAQESFIANGLKKLQWQMFYAYMYGTTQQDMEQNIVGKY